MIAVLLAVAALGAQGRATANQIAKGIDTLREQPDDKRPAVTLKLAMDIRALPPGMDKLELADGLSRHLATEGDPGQRTIRAVR